MAKSSRAPAAFSYFPIGYQGRAGSIVPSGTDIERPCGHFWAASQPDQAEEPAVKFGPSERMDYEVEFAAVVGKPLPMRKRLRAVDAEEHIFGFVILNDWSGGFASFNGWVNADEPLQLAISRGSKCPLWGPLMASPWEPRYRHGSSLWTPWSHTEYRHPHSQLRRLLISISPVLLHTT